MSKRILMALAMCLTMTIVMAQTSTEPSKVYFTSEITPEALLSMFKSLGVTPEGNVAVKISTGESAQSNHLRPELIATLVKDVKGTIVECNTAYGGNRSNTAAHRRAIEQRGYGEIAAVDIMDEDGSMALPMQDTKYFTENLVGSHLSNYDFMINLAHFKGHAMGGFGGVLKNQSIGVASADGKARIHTAGRYSNATNAFQTPENGQDGFLESMAGAAQSVHNYFKGKKGIVYINVMNNLSVDCDCSGHPSAPQMRDIGILASLDPVALDKACLDLVFNHVSTSGDNSQPLIQRINRQHGTHIVEYAEEIGLGSQSYELLEISSAGIGEVGVNAVEKYNVYDLRGVKVLSNADNLSSLTPGVYIVNGKKQIVE